MSAVLAGAILTKVGTLRAHMGSVVDTDRSLYEELHDCVDLLRACARLVEGKTIYHAFGAPGDWGYGTPIGDALAHVYREKEAVA